MRKLTASMLGAVALSLFACDQPAPAPEIVAFSELSFVVVSGDGQSGAPGAELADVLVVRAEDSRGHGIRDQIVNFRVVSGGGSVFAGAAITNRDGIARERWTLGMSGPQRVEARAVDPDNGDALTFGVFTATLTDGAAPVVSNVFWAPNPVTAGASLGISANVSDAATGGSNITAAEYRVDGGPYSTMTAVDGAFDEVAEAVQATIANIGAAGSRQVCVRGRDASNNNSGDTCVTVTVVPVTHTLTVTKAGNGSGMVTSNPAGITCGPDCSEVYSDGTNVILTAAPLPPSTFVGWSGACTGTGECAVTMNAAKSVTATFSVVQHLVTVTTAGTGGGTVTSSPPGINCGLDCEQNYNVGSTVLLGVEPFENATFTGWSGDCTGTDVICSLTMDGPKNATATFALKTHTLSVTKTGTGSGTVTSSPAGINCGADCSENYNDATIVTLTAAPAAGSFFDGWTGACTGGGACVVTMDAAKTVTASFTSQRFPLTTTIAGAGSGVVTSTPPGISCTTATSPCMAFFNAFTPVTLTAAPHPGSLFAGWTGNCSGTGTCTVTMDGSKSVFATFTPASFTLTVSRAGTGTGTVTGSGINCGSVCTANYAAGTMVTLTATPSSGSSFTGWSGGGCSGTGTCVVTMNSAVSVTATFTVSQFTLTVVRSGAGTGTVNSAPSGISCGADCTEVYNSGTMVTLTANPGVGSVFSGWSGGGCTGTGTCVVTIGAATTVTATFGVAANLSAPSSVDLGTIAVGTFSSQTIVVANTGGVPTGVITVTTGGFGGEIVMLSNGCGGQTLVSGASCNIVVRFGPTSAGAKTATLAVQAVPGGTRDITLTGTGF